MRVRRALAICSIVGWMLACGGGTDANPIADNSGQSGASANTGGDSSTGTAGSSGGMATGGAMGTGGVSETGGAGGASAVTGGSSGSGGSAMTDAQVAPDGHLDSGSDVATVPDAPAQCPFDRSGCQACIVSPNGPCYTDWKNCQNDANTMCAVHWKDADECACRYQTAGSPDKARECINGLAQYGVINRNLEACINNSCDKACGIAL